MALKSNLINKNSLVGTTTTSTNSGYGYVSLPSTVSTPYPTQPFGGAGLHQPINYGYSQPLKSITTEIENKLFYFQCHFDPSLYKEILEFQLKNIKYSSDNLELTYQDAINSLIVLISNNTSDKTTSFIFTLEDTGLGNKHNQNVKLVNQFKKEFMLLADKPATKCDNCLFIIDAKLESFCNKSYKLLGINNA